MSGQTIILAGPSQRQLAHRLIEKAGVGYVVTIKEPTRSTEQNSKMHAMLSDVSRAKPEGRLHTVDVWKQIMMNACGHKAQFEVGLDGEIFPAGLKTSRLNKREMSDMIEFIYWYGAQHDISWSEPNPDERKDTSA